jgi:hypothetical protein
MNINGQTLRRASGFAAAAILAITLGTVAPNSQGHALGPVTAITPREVIPNGFVGAVLNPSLSNRGEAAGVFDSQVQQDSFVFLDAPGQEPMVPGLGLTVSGNGCVALWARNNGSTDPQASVSIGVTDRCAGGERVLYNTNQNYQPGGALALSFDGRFGVFREAPCFACEFDSDDLFRIDTQTGEIVAVPHHGFPYFGWDATLGLDISDDGSVIVAVEVGQAASAVAIDLRDVVAWQVGAAQASFVSGNPSSAPGAGFPSISGDGRYVAFTSNKPLAPGTSGAGPWVFINDRATNAIRLVSPGAGIAYQPSISRDASQVAYAVGPTARACQFNRQTFAGLEQTCRGARIDVAYGPGPLSTAPISTETISLGLNNAPAAGLHVEPALSGNGQFVAWISDAGNALVDPADPAFKGLRQAFVRQRDVGLAVDALNFGTIQAGTASQLTANVTNTGHTSVQVDSIAVTPAQFTIQGGGSCAAGMVLAPGTACTVNVRYAAPNNNSTTNGIITVSESGFAPVSTTNTLVGSSSFTPPPTTSTTTTTTTVAGQRPPPTTTTTTIPLQIALTADPNPVDFGQVAVGIGSPIQTVTITNIGTGPGQVLTDLGGDNPQDFFVARNGCNEVTLAPNESCTMDIMMIPLAGGLRQASLILTAGGASGDIAMFGDGHFLPQLVASPESIAVDGFTTVIGLGFPPNQTFDIHIDPSDDVLTVTSDGQGQFQVPLSAVGKLSLGNYVLRVDGQPTVFDTVLGQLVVALPTFEPQAPGGAVFGTAQIVTRGG